MSQARIKSEQSKDWMRELDLDARNVQAIIQRIDEISAKAQYDLAVKKDPIAAVIKLGQIQEGMALLCELMDVEHIPYAQLVKAN